MFLFCFKPKNHCGHHHLQGKIFSGRYILIICFFPSSSMEEEEEEEHDLEEEEDLVFKSDHEFSPESDLENDADYIPVRRARTAQKGKLVQ